MKKTVTISISLPIEVAEQLDIACNELNVQRSPLVTAVISIALKWNLLKEGFNNGI